MRTVPPDRDFVSDITHMVKKCLRANMARMVHYTHRTDYSTSVAIARLAGAAALRGGGSTNESEPKGADCHSLGMQVGYSNGADTHSLPTTSRSKMNRLANPALSVGETLVHEAGRLLFGIALGRAKELLGTPQQRGTWQLALNRALQKKAGDGAPLAGPRTGDLAAGSSPGASNSTGRAGKRCVASTPIMEEPRTELCQLERTLGIRMERIQAIAICKRRVGFGVALIACHRLPSAEWFSSQENFCKRRQGPDVSPNIERRADSPLDRFGLSFENIRSRREQLM